MKGCLKLFILAVFIVIVYYTLPWLLLVVAWFMMQIA